MIFSKACLHRQTDAVHKHASIMKHVVASLLVSFLLLAVSGGTSIIHASGESFTGSSNFTGSRDECIAIDDIQVAGAGNENVNVNIFVSSGDLRLAVISGITFTSSTSGNDLQFSGSRSDVNTALSTLTFKPSLTTDFTIQFTIDGLINSIYDPVSHHVYQDVPNVWNNWHNAKIGAETAVFQNNAGYLATVTSSEEQDVIERLGRPGWLGGSDASNEGEWNWVGGPENGSNFWNGGPDGSVANGLFAHWSGDMPDNYTGSNPAGENCVEMRDRSSSYLWNDQNCDGGIVSDYIVEYGDDVNNPSVIYKDVSVHVTPGQDLNNDGTEDADQPQVADFLTNENKLAAVDLGFGCEVISSDLVSEETLDVTDELYDYPGGLLDFTGHCFSPMSTSFLRIFYYDELAADILLRKYNPVTQDYTTVTDVSVQDQIIQGHNVAVVTYTIADGNSFDTDGDPANNQFSDPIGLASLAAVTPPSPAPPVTAPSSEGTLAASGQQNIVYVYLTALLIPSSLAIVLHRKKSAL